MYLTGYSNLRKHCRNSRIGYSFYAIKDTAMITKLSYAIASSFGIIFPQSTVCKYRTGWSPKTSFMHLINAYLLSREFSVKNFSHIK